MSRAGDAVERLAGRIFGLMGGLLRPYLERARPYVAPYIARARARYERFEPREKLLVQIAGALVALLMSYNFVYLPVFNLREDLRQRIEQRQHQIIEVRRMVRDYQQLRLELKDAEKRTVRNNKDFSLFSALEGMLTNSVGVAKVGSINPGEDKKISKDLVQHNVQITLTGVSLAEIVDTLYGIKTLPVPVLVSEIHIKRGPLPTIFDVEMTCLAVGANG
jgi:type II secretory pathway component PulM